MECGKRILRGAGKGDRVRDRVNYRSCFSSSPNSPRWSRGFLGGLPTGRMLLSRSILRASLTVLVAAPTGGGGECIAQPFQLRFGLWLVHLPQPIDLVGQGAGRQHRKRLTEGRHALPPPILCPFHQVGAERGAAPSAASRLWSKPSWITWITTTKIPRLLSGRKPPMRSWNASLEFVNEFLIQDTRECT
jgi:hypothetical protein